MSAHTDMHLWILIAIIVAGILLIAAVTALGTILFKHAMDQIDKLI